MSTTIDQDLDVTVRKKVLVIAYPEIASAIYDALKPYTQAPTRAEVDPSDGAVEINDYTVSWLCAQIFPSPKDVANRASMRRVRSALKHWGRKQPIHISPSACPAPTDSTMSLFKWGDYDFVIIQDLWPVRSSSGHTLECAGYVLANLDYYLWGNFGTKKIILVTDKSFPLRKAEWIRQSLGLFPTSSLKAALSAFDQKQAFELVELTGGPEPAKRLIQLLKGEENSDDLRSKESSLDDSGTHGNEERNEASVIFDSLLRPVIEEAGKALQSYVGHHAEVLVVDDELKDLNNTFEQLTGKALSEQRNLSPDRVNVVTASEGIVQQAETFDALVDLCEAEFQKAARGSKPYTLLVTDILFRGPTWHKTGLDLIETLRLKSKQQEKARRTGIVAYTAFTTPFIAMSSYQRGADFVVAKTALGAHDLNVKGAERLMMTLAFLCFQKSFLSDKRKEAGEHIKKAGSGKSFDRSQRILQSLHQLQAVLPKYSVSLHLQQEWLDTCYLFEALNVYGSGSEQPKLVYDEVSHKYD